MPPIVVFDGLCAISLEPIYVSRLMRPEELEEEDIVVLHADRVSHAFKGSALAEWAKRNPICPTCKEPLTLDERIRLNPLSKMDRETWKIYVFRIVSSQCSGIEIIYDLLRTCPLPIEEGLKEIIQCAVRYKHTHMIQLVLNNSVSRSEKCRGFAMIQAAESGFLDMVQFLLENNASISEEDRGLAVIEAAKKNKLFIIAFLLRENHSISPTNRVMAIEAVASVSGDVTTLQFLTRDHASIDRYTFPLTLLCAINAGHSDAVEFLCDYVKENQVPINKEFLINNLYKSSIQNLFLKALDSLSKLQPEIFTEQLEDLRRCAAEFGNGKIFRFVSKQLPPLSQEKKQILIRLADKNDSQPNRVEILRILMQSPCIQ